MEHTNKEKLPNWLVREFIKLRIFILYMWGFIKFGLEQWKQKSTFEVKEIKDIIFLHFHPDLSPEPALVELKKSFVDAYIKLNGKDPIVVAIPYGYNISTLNLSEFITVLNTEQVNDMQRALYAKKGKIQLVNA
jgi:hypothetical protein